VIAARLEREYPRENKDTGALVIPLGQEVSQRSRLLLLALSAAAGCVLLIACANLANLLLARALSRRRELAVRTAIGAGRERLVRQLMTENLLLAGVGGSLGIGLAIASVPLLARLVPATLPIAETPSVDLRVLLVAVGLTALTGIAFGLAPVVRIGRRPDLDGLREGARAGGGQKERLRSALVVGEVIASVVLLVSAGLLIRALLTVQAIDPGFNAEGVLTLRTELPMPEYGPVVARETYYSVSFRTSGHCPACGRRASSVFCRFLRSAGDLAGFGQRRRRRGAGYPQRQQRGRDPVRHAGVLRGDGHSAQARARHRRG
jgi:putative ABC transport system permease protein